MKKGGHKVRPYMNRFPCVPWLNPSLHQLVEGTSPDGPRLSWS